MHQSEMYSSLENLLNVLSYGRKFHIAVNDLSGILKQPLLRLEPKDCIHSKSICSAAKTTTRGFRYCWTCKCFATRKAVRGQEDFSGRCPIGLFEITHPVVERGKVLCVVSIGNLLVDRAGTEALIRRTCARTGVPAERVLRYLDETEPFDPEFPYGEILRMVDSYIRLVAEAQSQRETDGALHWAVERAMNYAHSYYHNDITLKQLARLIYINSKYLGRLFHQQTGVTFHAYLNELRLQHALNLLVETDRKMIEIAGQVGFETVTYFNRRFRQKYGCTPTEYRAKMREKGLHFPEKMVK